MPKNRPPRWGKWKLMPEVKAWEAVALSLDIEPSEIETHPDVWLANSDRHPFNEGNEFDDRLAVLLANLSDRASFSPCAISLSYRHENSVQLGEFSAWASRVADWSIPQELRALSRDSDAPKSAARPVSRHDYQEQEILRVIRELGYNPKSLPKSSGGKAGVKAEVRRKLTFSQVVFDKAWERLRDSDEIVDAN
jgi:hypothetical protein